MSSWIKKTFDPECVGGLHTFRLGKYRVVLWNFGIDYYKEDTRG